LNAADLAFTDLNHYSEAANLYERTLQDFPRNADYASQATLALGRIALAQHNAELAQKYFGRVLDRFKSYPERCAEAQYQTGVVAETLTRRAEVAKTAYQLTIKNYPATVWATNAKARLGMLFYGDIAPGGPARRVMTKLAPLPDTGFSENSPFLPLALVLSARGMDIGPATLNAWALQPFVAGFDKSKPGRIITAGKAFENAVANAGLHFSVQNGEDATKSFTALREALDRGHTPVAYLGKWALVVGYDTVAQSVSVQYEGAQVKTMPLDDFLDLWGKSKPRSNLAPRQAYTFLSFQAEGDNPKVTESTAPQQQAQSRLSITPSFELTLTPLSRKNADRRTIRRAALLLQRAHLDGALLNVEALNQLADDLAIIGTPPPSPVPVPEAEDATPPSAEPVDWQQRLKRAAQLAPWFNAPLQQWIETRRDAATYLESVARTLDNRRLHEAASELRHSIMALQNASIDFPDALQSGTAGNWTMALGQQLQRTAQDLREAKTAESNAARLLREAS